MKTVSLIVPIFNEVENLPDFFHSYQVLRDSESRVKISIILIDNGSTDGSRDLVRKFVQDNPGAKAFLLTRNFGKESSISCGLKNCDADAAVPIDADLQEPPEIISRFISSWLDGADVVLRRRTEVSKGFRFWLSMMYRKSFNRLSDSRLDESVGEFRLMDKKVVEAFNSLPETQRFVRGMFSWLGFKTVEVLFERPNRANGTSKFSPIKLARLGVEGITSFSTAPLRIAIYFGFTGALLATIWGLWILLLAIQGQINVVGYASTILAVLLIGSVQLISIGILGEYLGKTLMESKRRPLYVIEESL